ncbi:MAG: aminotransferase class I/II-fold pyridoxal phosphate-dependent enzyme [Lentisphaerae bacterium]|nr:aminotransferase class I/II-fold pyridoxal phosphate-dependent enzyme [Lentisphaerota bacterium]
MYRIGREEVDAISEVLLSGKVFRYGIGSACTRFEERYAKYLGIKHVMMTSSGTTALTAALVGQRIGPGDEVLVPACTYIATAIAVVAAGAIPVIVDIDESLTLDPRAVEAAIGPRTRAMIPVHMWGLVCDMDRLMAIARRHRLAVVEDACQCVGGGYKGRKVGSIGHAAGFSFNYYKNMTCGEGGAAVTNDDAAVPRMGCMVDCCKFYWTDRKTDESLFISNGARASELEGAILNIQLDRIDGMLDIMRGYKKRVLAAVADTGLRPIQANSLDCEAGTHVMFVLPTEAQASQFQQITGSGIAGKTGRHVYTEWDPIFEHRGAPYEAMNPYAMEANRDCRMDYRKDMCAPSLNILNRTAMFGLHPDRTDAQIDDLIARLRKGAAQVL